MTRAPLKKTKKRQSNKLKPVSAKKRASINADVTEAHDQYDDALTKRATFKTSDADLGHDLVQTTFLKTLLYLHKGGKIDIMRAFLNRVLNDLIVDEYRKRKTISLDILFENGYEPSTDDTERLMNIFDGKKVILLIDQLPAKYRTIIWMRYVQDLSLKEISVLTNQTENTVAVQAYRGLKKLKVIETASHK